MLLNYLAYVNWANRHKKYGQLDLGLGNFGFTQSGILNICTTVDLGVGVTYDWLLLFHRVERDHEDKDIFILE